MTRAEKVAMARELRGGGLLMREIAERMGVATSTVDNWLNDPDLAKAQARRERYSASCERCGGPTDGSGGYAVQRSICAGCRHWTDEQIIEALRNWADRHGRSPRGEDWEPATEDHPSATIVNTRLGWNKALLLAGLPLNMDRRPETQAWIVAQLRSGRSVPEVAAELGITARAIYNRMQLRGVSVPQIRASERMARKAAA